MKRKTVKIIWAVSFFLSVISFLAGFQLGETVQGPAFFFLCSLGCLGVYIWLQACWWMILPGGLFTGLGLVTVLENILPHESYTMLPYFHARIGFYTWVLILSLSFTFVVLWLMRHSRPTGWAIYLAAGLFVIAVLAFSYTFVTVARANPSPTLETKSPQKTSEPMNQTLTGSHPPVILRVVQRDEIINDSQYIFKDIYFNDLDGDAVALTHKEVSSSVSYSIPLTDEPIEASLEEQKGEALFTFGGRCLQKLDLVLESRIRDQTGNFSDPVTLHISCTTPPTVDSGSILVGGLSMAFPLALILLLGFWLLFRNHPGDRLPALRSMFFLFCLLLVVNFVGMVLHEGGHALYLVVRKVSFSIYVHPFSFPGYARPVIDTSIWKDILGSSTSLPLSLLISLPFWKRRSLALLPLVMLFPYQAIYDGRNVLGWLGGDFANLIQTNGLSPIPFIIIGTLVILVGIFLLFGLLPLIGLDPRDKKSMFVLPAATLLVSTLSLLVACLLVPGSPFDREYFLGQEIVNIAKMILPIQTIFWLVLSVLYVTLYRRVYPRLPAWLRIKTVQLEWKDLRLPTLLASASITIGLIIIT